MKISYFLVALFISIFQNSHGYFYHNIDSIGSNENSSFINNFKIEFAKTQNKFPDYFTVKINELGREFNIGFKRIKEDTNSGNNPGVYIVNNGAVEKFNPENDEFEEYEHYSQDNGSGFATLIRNKLLREDPFRMIGTIHDNNNSDIAFDIVPIINATDYNGRVDSNRSKRNTEIDGFELNEYLYDSSINHHGIIKRNNEKYANDEKIYNSLEVSQRLNEIKSQNKRDARKNKRAVNGQPVVFYVETLVVPDYSVVQNHMTYLRTTNLRFAFQHIVTYYAFLFNGINQRYQNSLSADPDMRINIRFTNILIPSSESESTWTSAALAGDTTYPTYNGRAVIRLQSTFSSFTNYLSTISGSLPFTYDHAVGFFNKELINDNLQDTLATRVGVAGFSPIGNICVATSKISIVEDWGGFSNILTTAHEMGHNLGAEHDGILGTFSNNLDCPVANNYIMVASASISASQTNLYYFSTCTIRQWKSVLLVNNGVASSTAQCLLNVPQNTPSNISISNSYSSTVYPGQVYTPMDQCRMIYGNDATLCKTDLSNICTRLQCRSNLASTSCNFFAYGAAEGTPCDTGKVCINGVCTASPLGPTNSSCLFGDDLFAGVELGVYGLQIPNTLISCPDLFTYLTTNGLPINVYCNIAAFNSRCCQSCKKYQRLTCADTSSVCAQARSNPNYCNGATFNGPSGPVSFKTACPRSCGTCTGALTCSSSSFLCMNGGTCRNITVSATSLFGFTCDCPIGYSGELCEIKNPCLPNPCNNGATCLAIGNGTLGYLCLCTSLCSGYNCSSCTGTTATLTSPITLSTTTTTATVSTTTTRASTASTTTTSTTTTRVTTTAATNPNNPTASTTTTSTTTRFSSTTASPSQTSSTLASVASSTTSNSNTFTCTDKYPFLCQYFVSVNPSYCGDQFYFAGEPMTTACRRSCNTCCIDYQLACPEWASKNYCSPLGIITPHPCPKSCNLC